MYIKIISTLLTWHLLVLIAYSQEFAAGRLSIEVIDDSLTCHKECDTVSISFLLRNESNDDVIVYGLKNGAPYPPFVPLAGLCDTKNTGTGIAFGVFDLEGKHMKPEVEISHRHGERKVTEAMLDSALNEVRRNFLNSAIVIKKNEATLFKKLLPLKDLILKKGIYYLQLVYYTGDFTMSQLQVNGVNSQTVFYGCVMSSKIRLIVE